MKPTKKQLQEFPSVINMIGPDGENCGDIPGNLLWEYMVKNGYKKMNSKEIEKAANELVKIMLDEYILEKNLTKLQKKSKTKKRATAKNKPKTKKVTKK
jgi:hypothetical protein